MPNQWLAQLLADELRASGFTVLPADDSDETSAVKIDGSLLKLFVEPVPGAFSGSLEADLSVKLHLTSAGGLDAERTFYVKGWKGGQLASTMQPYHTALHRATQDLLAQMVNSIVELMNRYPELGMSPAPSVDPVRRHGRSPQMRYAAVLALMFALSGCRHVVAGRRRRVGAQRRTMDDQPRAGDRGAEPFHHAVTGGAAPHGERRRLAPRLVLRR